MVRCIWFFGNLFDDSSGSFHYCDHPYSGTVLPVQRSYINAREWLRLWWTKQNKSNPKEAKTNKKRDVNWWPEKCLCTVNQELIPYTYPQGNDGGLVWCSRICAKSAWAPFCNKKKKGKKGKIKEDSGIGNSSKEAVVSSWVHTALCALREQLCECLWGAALQHCSMARASCHPTGLLLTFAPTWSSLPSPNTSVGQKPLRGPSLGHPISHIPYPASPPAMGQAELGRFLLTPTKGKSVVSFWAKSCRYLGYNSQFGEVSGKPQWLPWPLDLAWKAVSGLGAVVPCVEFHRAVCLAGLAPILECLQDQTPRVHLF